MVQVITSASLAAPLVLGLTNLVIVEVCKRVPQIPLDPNNKNQVKFVSGLITLIGAVGYVLLGKAALADIDWQSALNQMIQLWLEGWIVSHVAYNATPFMKQTPPPGEDGGSSAS